MMSLPLAGEAFPGSPVQLERGLHLDDPRDHQEPAGVLQQVGTTSGSQNHGSPDSFDPEVFTSLYYYLPTREIFCSAIKNK